jgi:predicted CXXCH cytochrome family protein
MKPTRKHCLPAIWLVAALITGCRGASDAPADGASDAPSPLASFVGNDVCAACHAEQADAWTDSQHERAMRAASVDTVLGDFDDARFSRGGVTSTFGRRGADFIVNTDGPDGRLTDYRVAYTFGIEPLQQYLLEMPDGRYQALDIAWDTRPADRGGQRWFHLQPGESIPPGDPLHWTGLLHNWNSNCAECHSTDVHKNYDPERHAYATSASNINVGCEACHGPGSSHAAAPAEVELGLAAVARAWVFAEDESIAHRVPASHSDTEIEACAQCHARRSQLTDDFVPGDRFLDGFRPAFLTDPLYYADGQIRDEVYVYGSFLQSRMHAGGVTCTDCHDPHSTRLRAEGNAVCTQCHLPSTFDTPAHHRHAASSPGAECVSCHMRAETYMVVDPRRDHSFRVPRPDLSVTLGTPNACSDCHDESVAWAAEQVAAWYPNGRTNAAHYAQALHAGRNWSADRGRLLNGIVADAEMPAIVRATALTLLTEQLDAAAIDGVRSALASGEPLVELAALDALAAMPIELRADLGQRFLTNAPLALRLAAAEALLPARGGLSARRQIDLDAGIDELRAMHRFNMDRPEGLLSRASLELALGRTETAEAALHLAIEREPAYAASYVNLADLYRRLGREPEAEQTLREGLAAAPDSAALAHALGLALVRAGRPGEALPLLERASEREPDIPRYAYVYGVALNSLATPAEALESLARTHERFPGHTPTLVALATMQRDAGNVEQALDYARRLLDVSPADPTGRALVDELQ